MLAYRGRVTRLVSFWCSRRKRRELTVHRTVKFHLSSLACPNKRSRCLHILGAGDEARNTMVLPPSSRRQAALHRRAAFDLSSPACPNKRSRCLRILGAGDEARNTMVLPPSSRRQAGLHRRAAFDLSSLACPNKRSRCLRICFFYLERVTRLELATSTLARWRSTR